MRVREIGHVLRRLEFGIARHGPQFPCHLVEVAIVEHQDDQAGIGPALPIFADRNEFVHPVHLHRAVANHGNHDAVRIGELGRDRIRYAGAHRREIARQRGHHPAADFDVACVPVRRGARVRGQDAIIRQPWRQLPEDALRIERIGLVHGAPLEHLPPLRHAFLDFISKRAIGLALKQRNQRTQRRSAVALQIDLHRIPDAQHLSIDVDLNAASLSFLGQKFGIGKARSRS